MEIFDSLFSDDTPITLNGNGKAYLHNIKATTLPSLEILLNASRNQTKSIIRFCGEHFLRHKRICTGIGPAGAGKSNLSEGIVSSHLNNHCDSFKIEVISDPDRPLLFIDMERTQDEILEGCDRIRRRIYADNNPELLTEERFKNTFIHSFLQYPDPKDKIFELERLIKLYRPFLVVLDGAASLVLDVNDTRECVYLVNTLLSIADREDLSFFSTIHPNPGQQNDFKPRGVLGSELIRQSESVLLLKRAPDDRDTRILTTSFMHGKNRSGADSLESYFRWNDQHKMFLSCDYAPSTKPGKAEDQNKTFRDILANDRMTYRELVGKLVEAGKSEPTAKRWISDAVKREVIFNQNGAYGLSPF